MLMEVHGGAFDDDSFILDFDAEEAAAGQPLQQPPVTADAVQRQQIAAANLQPQARRPVKGAKPAHAPRAAGHGCSQGTVKEAAADLGAFNDKNAEIEALRRQIALLQQQKLAGSKAQGASGEGARPPAGARPKQPGPAHARARSAPVPGANPSLAEIPVVGSGSEPVGEAAAANGTGPVQQHVAVNASAGVAKGRAQGAAARGTASAQDRAVAEATATAATGPVVSAKRAAEASSSDTIAVKRRAKPAQPGGQSQQQLAPPEQQPSQARQQVSQQSEVHGAEAQAPTPPISRPRSPTPPRSPGRTLTATQPGTPASQGVTGPGIEGPTTHSQSSVPRTSQQGPEQVQQEGPRHKPDPDRRPQDSSGSGRDAQPSGRDTATAAQSAPQQPGQAGPGPPAKRARPTVAAPAKPAVSGSGQGAAAPGTAPTQMAGAGKAPLARKAGAGPGARGPAGTAAGSPTAKAPGAEQPSRQLRRVRLVAKEGQPGAGPNPGGGAAGASAVGVTGLHGAGLLPGVGLAGQASTGAADGAGLGIGLGLPLGSVPIMPEAEQAASAFLATFLSQLVGAPEAVAFGLSQTQQQQQQQQESGGQQVVGPGQGARSGLAQGVGQQQQRKPAAAAPKPKQQAKSGKGVQQQHRAQGPTEGQPGLPEEPRGGPVQRVEERQPPEGGLQEGHGSVQCLAELNQEPPRYEPVQQQGQPQPQEGESQQQHAPTAVAALPPAEVREEGGDVPTALPGGGPGRGSGASGAASPSGRGASPARRAAAERTSVAVQRMRRRPPAAPGQGASSAAAVVAAPEVPAAPVLAASVGHGSAAQPGGSGPASAAPGEALQRGGEGADVLPGPSSGGELAGVAASGPVDKPQQHRLAERQEQQGQEQQGQGAAQPEAHLLQRTGATECGESPRAGHSAGGAALGQPGNEAECAERELVDARSAAVTAAASVAAAAEEFTFHRVAGGHARSAPLIDPGAAAPGAGAVVPDTIMGSGSEVLMSNAAAVATVAPPSALTTVPHVAFPAALPATAFDLRTTPAAQSAHVSTTTPALAQPSTDPSVAAPQAAHAGRVAGQHPPHGGPQPMSQTSAPIASVLSIGESLPAALPAPGEPPPQRSPSTESLGAVGSPPPAPVGPFWDSTVVPGQPSGSGGTAGLARALDLLSPPPPHPVEHGAAPAGAMPANPFGPPGLPPHSLPHAMGAAAPPQPPVWPPPHSAAPPSHPFPPWSTHSAPAAFGPNFTCGPPGGHPAAPYAQQHLPPLHGGVPAPLMAGMPSPGVPLPGGNGVVSFAEVDVLARKEMLLIKWRMLQELAGELDGEWRELCVAHHRLRLARMQQAGQAPATTGAAGPVQPSLPVAPAAAAQQAAEPGVGGAGVVAGQAVTVVAEGGAASLLATSAGALAPSALRDGVPGHRSGAVAGGHAADRLQETLGSLPDVAPAPRSAAAVHELSAAAGPPAAPPQHHAPASHQPQAPPSRQHANDERCLPVLPQWADVASSSRQEALQQAGLPPLQAGIGNDMAVVAAGDQAVSLAIAGPALGPRVTGNASDAGSVAALAAMVAAALGGSGLRTCQPAAGTGKAQQSAQRQAQPQQPPQPSLQARAHQPPRGTLRPLDRCPEAEAVALQAESELTFALSGDGIAGAAGSRSAMADPLPGAAPMAARRAGADALAGRLDQLEPQRNNHAAGDGASTEGARPSAAPPTHASDQDARQRTGGSSGAGGADKETTPGPEGSNQDAGAAAFTGLSFRLQPKRPGAARALAAAGRAAPSGNGAANAAGRVSPAITAVVPRSTVQPRRSTSAVAAGSGGSAAVGAGAVEAATVRVQPAPQVRPMRARGSAAGAPGAARAQGAAEAPQLLFDSNSSRDAGAGDSGGALQGVAVPVEQPSQAAQVAFGGWSGAASMPPDSSMPTSHQHQQHPPHAGAQQSQQLHPLQPSASSQQQPTSAAPQLPQPGQPAAVPPSPVVSISYQRHDFVIGAPVHGSAVQAAACTPSAAAALLDALSSRYTSPLQVFRSYSQR